MIVRGVLQRWTFDKKPLLKYSFSENMVKIIENPFKGVHFGSFLGAGLHLYSRTNCCTTICNCFSTLAEQPVFKTPPIG